MVHRCALCGQISFETYHAYELHRMEYHRMTRQIKPENVTGRSHAQIVEDAERTWLEPHLVKLDKPILVRHDTQHTEDCNCVVCFNLRLDRLVISSAQTLADMTVTPDIQDINYVG